MRIRLSSLPRNASFGASALLHINQHIVATFNRNGYNGVLVSVPDIEEGTGKDLRVPGDTVLRIRVWTGRVSRVTSIADGDRFGGLSVHERTNHAAHAWIRDRSPVRPGGVRGLLGIEKLEDYAAQLSRHPGRRVEAELTPGDRAGTTSVNLRVAENKPWYAYAQYTNTGTSTTSRNRERLGFAHHQLTGRDDILRLDYTTGDFDRVHAVVGSYVAPLSLENPKWRYGLSGWYSQFDAEETGFTNTDVDGSEISVGGEISRQVHQHGELFVDVAVGARWQRLSVESQQLELQGFESNADYLVPSADLRVQRDTATSTLRFRAGVMGGWTDTRARKTTGDASGGLDVLGQPIFVPGPSRLDLLGTPNADDDFMLASFDASLAFYLEPLINRAAWEDPSTPGSSTLAHELAFRGRGQWAMGNRLVPHFQDAAGGFYTVRGYRQSAVVGDDVVVGTAEYRLHLPRLFAPSDTANPPQLPGVGDFHVRAPHVWGVPDWDLILRLFGDAAYVESSEALASEPDETLVSIGAGLELQILRNLTLRADVGHVLHDLRVRSGEDGETRGHLAATLLY